MFTKKKTNLQCSKHFRTEALIGIGLNSGVTFDLVVLSSGWE